MTRQLVISVNVSADGFFEDADADISWGRVDEELHQHFNDHLRTMGAFLDGRVTYELMAEYWPTADEDPDNAPVEREFARIWREMPKVVYSRTLASAGWGTTIEREVDPAAVRALKAEPGGDLSLGGADLSATFLAHGLVDEIRLYVHPVVLGRGRRFFSEDSRLDLELVESRTFGGGVVLLRYAVTEPTGTPST